MTLGLVFVAFGVCLWQFGDSTVASWSWWWFSVLASFMFGGVCLVAYGLLGPSSKMESLAEASARHEASLIIMVLAYPVYFVLVPFYDPR